VSASVLERVHAEGGAHGSTQSERARSRRAPSDLFIISAAILFLELACIRFFSAQVLFLTFFTNGTLLACFLGLSLGLTAGRGRDYRVLSVLALVAALVAPYLLFVLQDSQTTAVHLEQSPSAGWVFFGTEYPRLDAARLVVPVEAVNGFFFVALALAFVGPGQQLARAFRGFPHAVGAYSLNIVGSIAGIVAFVACSWLEVGPLGWFLVVLAAFGYFFVKEAPAAGSLSGICLLAVAAFAILRLADTGAGGYLRENGNYTASAWQDILPGIFERPGGRTQAFWSPYYRIDYDPEPRRIYVNLIVHQQMVARASPYPAYALAHLFNRDTGRPPFGDVLIIGAGSGNDVSRALQWGARRVDAVEIDPVIQRLGRDFHPDRPYQDERVTVHIDDGRNFLRGADRSGGTDRTVRPTDGAGAERSYDLIVYALVDSLVLHSGYSNIRLESYLFTREALADVRRRLKPGGLFVVYNHFRQGWLIARLQRMLDEAFGEPPLVLTLPHKDKIEAAESWNGFTIFMAGDTKAIRAAFAGHGGYWLDMRQAPALDSANGFVAKRSFAKQRGSQTEFGNRGQNRGERNDGDGRERLALSEVMPAEEMLPVPADDWPFLYLRERVIPVQNLFGLAIMGGAALALTLLLRPGQTSEVSETSEVSGRGLSTAMFFLGAGFMLLETKAVVHMALLFGSTWLVNAVVFAAVLIMILAANLAVLAFRPTRLRLFYAGLVASLLVNCVVPLDYFLGMNWLLQVTLSCLVVFTPLAFAGVIFAVLLGRHPAPERALGVNMAGAMVGGLAEYYSLILGFQYLLLVAIAFYLLSGIWVRRGRVSTVQPAG